MKRVLCLLTISIGLFPPCFAQQSASKSDAEKAAQAQADAYVAAFNKADAKALGAFYTEDAQSARVAVAAELNGARITAPIRRGIAPAAAAVARSGIRQITARIIPIVRRARHVRINGRTSTTTMPISGTNGSRRTTSTFRTSRPTA